MAIGTSMFLLPNKFSTGGVTGIATIVYYLFKIPLGTVNILINIPILIFTFYRLGKTVVINSIIGSLVYSLAIDVLDKFPAFTNDVFLASIYGGVFLGIGTGIVLNANATTGGTELVSNLIKTYNFNIKTSSLIMLIDSSIVLLNVLVFKEIEIGLYSAIAIILMGKVIDIIVEGTDFSKLIFIISEKNDKISKEIGEYIKRGTTGIYGKGMFEDKDYANGTRKIYECITGNNIKTIIGGGDSASSVKNLGFDGKFYHISTGGGATLEYLSGEILPGISVIEDEEEDLH